MRTVRGRKLCSTRKVRARARGLQVACTVHTHREGLKTGCRNSHGQVGETNEKNPKGGGRTKDTQRAIEATRASACSGPSGPRHRVAGSPVG